MANLNDGKIRIAFVIDQIFYPTAGTENQVLRLIKLLDKKLFIPYLVVLHPSPWLTKNSNSFETYSLGIKKVISIKSIIEMFKLVFWLRKKNISIIQTFFKDSNIIGILSGAAARVPCILSSRRNIGYDSSSKDIWISRLLDSFVDYYMANGDKVKEYVVKHEKVQANKMKVFYNLIDLRSNAYSTEDKETKKALRVKDNNIVFLMIANLRPVKSHRFLLEAIHKLYADIPNGKFILVGGDPSGKKVEDTEEFIVAREMGLDNKVTFCGLQEDIKAFLEIADVGVLCSSSEGFSSTLLEYISYGLPCIATDVGSNCEIVVDGFNGILVKNGDIDGLCNAILKMYSNTSLRKKMGENSKKHFMLNFQPDTMIKRIEHFYISEFRTAQMDT